MSGSLSLQNQLLSTEQIKCSPSNKHGISNEIEDEILLFGTQLIQSAGVLLEL